MSNKIKCKKKERKYESNRKEPIDACTFYFRNFTTRLLLCVTVVNTVSVITFFNIYFRSLLF